MVMDMSTRLIDDLAVGKHKFAELEAGEEAKIKNAAQLCDRLHDEMEAFGKYVKDRKEYFMAMGTVTDRKILDKEKIKEFRTEIYRTGTNLDYVRKRINSSTRLAATIDKVRKDIEDLKAAGIATDKANDIINHRLWPGLGEVQKEVQKIADFLFKKIRKDLGMELKLHSKTVKESVRFFNLM